MDGNPPKMKLALVVSSVKLNYTTSAE